MKEIENLIQLINSYPSDIKAEVLVADLVREGYSMSDLLVLFESGFKRRYSKDILGAEKKQLNSSRQVLAIRVSRDGFYDLLPEGLFLDSPEAAMTSGKGMALESKKESKIEEETRKFFLPFENEFFNQRVQIELKERDMFEKLNENSLDDFFLNFWKTDRSLPEDLVVKLCTMLPFTREIVGDFKMTASCLGAILGEKVTCSVSYASVPYPGEADAETGDDSSLGKAILGVTLLTSGSYPENCKLVRFTIGPLEKTGIAPYLETGDISRFMQCFFSYFIPLEINASFDVLMPENLKEFVLGSEQAQSIMGFSTVI